MDYSKYVLSAFSKKIPEIGECDRCPFVNKCNSGDKCLVLKSEIKHRDKKAYYQKNREKILEYQKLLKALKGV